MVGKNWFIIKYSRNASKYFKSILKLYQYSKIISEGFYTAVGMLQYVFICILEYCINIPKCSGGTLECARIH